MSSLTNQRLAPIVGNSHQGKPDAQVELSERPRRHATNEVNQMKKIYASPPDPSREKQATADAMQGHFSPALTKKAKALALCATIGLTATFAGAAEASESSGEAALAGCAEGAVMATVAVWTVALVAAIPTSGASLAAAATVEATGGSLLLGCTTGAAGRWTVARLFGG